MLVSDGSDNNGGNCMKNCCVHDLQLHSEPSYEFMGK